MDIGNLKYFGTDGFRGEPNVNLTSMQAYKVGRFLGSHYSECKPEKRKARILIGKDTRQSGYMLEYAIAAGITASGTDVYLMHVTTTPSVSYICKKYGFDCGVMITASHNPYYDNGIKVINRDGEKLDEETTGMIESYIDGSDKAPLAKRDRIGRIYDHSEAREKYIRHLISLIPNSLKDLKIGIDCANGSSWMIADRVFTELGAKTVVINNTPNGTNINENCGSTHIEYLQDLVRKEKLDVGFAFDGDADRCIAVDSYGNIIDGDKIIYIIANRFKRIGILNNDTVAITVMSNLGLINSLKSDGINARVTNVGDKYVYQCMKDKGYQLGGEQSGHIIMLPYSVTGDGILTALIIADEMVETTASLSDLSKKVILFPQKTVNLKVKNKSAIASDELICRKVSELNDAIHPNGRIILRASGTEDLIRLTVEAAEIQTCEECIETITKVIKERDGLL